jgi:hypothetical protein
MINDTDKIADYPNVHTRVREKTIIDYGLIFGDSRKIVIDAVRININMGWQPLVECVTFTDTNGINYLQTVVKYGFL